MSVIRVSSCSYNIYNRSYVLNVEVLDSEDKNNDMMYLCIVPTHEVKSLEDFKSYIEKDIISQRKYKTLPDYTGAEWKSSAIELNE